MCLHFLCAKAVADSSAAYLFHHLVLFVEELHFDVSTHRQRLGELKVHVLVFTPRVCRVRRVDPYLQLVHHKVWICQGDSFKPLRALPSLEYTHMHTHTHAYEKGNIKSNCLSLTAGGAASWYNSSHLIEHKKTNKQTQNLQKNKNEQKGFGINSVMSSHP